MKYTHLSYAVKDRVAHITLDRPEKRNAFNAVLVQELSHAVSEAEKSAEVRVILLKSTGSAFCSGADLEYLREIAEYSFDRNMEDSQALMRLFLQMYKSKKPIIAQVQGPALAGGCGLASVCDIVIASEEAVFGYPEVRIGFVAALVMVFLVRRVGEGRARELLITGKTITAVEAERMGLVNAVVKPQELEAEATSVCRQIADDASGSSIAITKEILAQLHGTDTQNSLSFASRMNAASRMTEDCRRGIDAFLNKKKITW
jgi:methylglutaconyl-CoA hydratase